MPFLRNGKYFFDKPNRQISKKINPSQKGFFNFLVYQCFDFPVYQTNPSRFPR